MYCSECGAARREGESMTGRSAAYGSCERGKNQVCILPERIGRLHWFRSPWGFLLGRLPGPGFSEHDAYPKVTKEKGYFALCSARALSNPENAVLLLWLKMCLCQNGSWSYESRPSTATLMQSIYPFVPRVFTSTDPSNVVAPYDWFWRQWKAS